MNIISSTKTKIKTLATLMIAFIIGLLALSINPIRANADVGDVDFTVSNDGKLSVTSSDNSMSTSGTSASAWNGFIKKYRTFIVGISGLGAVSMILFFIFNFLKLGAVSGNPSERSKAIGGLIWSGLAAAGLGAVTIIVGFFYSALK